MKTAISRFAVGMVLCAMLPCLPASAQTKSALDAGVADCVKQFNLIDSRHQDLEDRAAGILVFPQVTKGGIALASEMDDYDSYKLKRPILVFTFAERGLIADVSLHGTRVRRI